MTLRFDDETFIYVRDIEYPPRMRLFPLIDDDECVRNNSIFLTSPLTKSRLLSHFCVSKWLT